MKAVQKFMFVYENNYRQTVLPTTDTTTPNIIERDIKDRFRQIIGNYWFPKLPNGQVDTTPPSGITPSPTETTVSLNSRLVWGEKKVFPFQIKVGKTHSFSTSKTIPSLLTTTTITLVADKRFGAYPECFPCWYRYLYGHEYGDPNTTYDKVYGFDPLKLQEIESTIKIHDPLSFDLRQEERIGKLTPLTILLLADVGLPTTERLAEIGVDISYLSFGKTLENAIRSMSEPRQQPSATSTTTTAGGITVSTITPSSGGTLGSGQATSTTSATSTRPSAGGVELPSPFVPQQEVFRPYILTYNAKIFRDTYFDNEMATLTKIEEDSQNTIDYNLNATVEFIHNYTAREYEEIITQDTYNLGLNDFGGERKLLNMYEWIYNERLQPIIVKLRTDVDCFAQNLAVFFRTSDTSVIYILGHTVPLINKFYPFQTLMPYYSRINFKLQPSGPITISTQETRNDGLVMRHLQEMPAMMNMNDFRTFKQSLGVHTESARTNPQSLSILFAENRDLIKSWEYYEWFLKLRERISNSMASPISRAANPLVDYLPQNSIIIDKGSVTARYTSGEDNRRGDVAYDVYTKALHAKMVDIINDNHRTYPELLKGIKPHKEVIAYKIKKYSNEDLTGLMMNSNNIFQESGYAAVETLDRVNPVQEIWVFNTKEEELINYIDTQIKTDKYYTYLVFAYLVVLDSEYYYTNVGNVPKPNCEDKYRDFVPNPDDPFIARLENVIESRTS